MQLLIVNILIHGVNYDIKNVLWLSKSFLTIDDLLFADTKVMNIFNIVLASSGICFHFAYIFCSGTSYVDMEHNNLNDNFARYDNS